MIWLWFVWSVVSGFFVGKYSSDDPIGFVSLALLVAFNVVIACVIHSNFGFGF